ncbi:hypothetical protein THAOC_30508 [Thalassiosira oceanica]|uniref:Uncharacterized protein n=1 Tax=Thalassiosira oceanica TaxID=159749 RepID=K0RA39_THAOC|nr:hypothetical protein THAOC_30508 [Thalassiosira oceanica]|eukprot:EJK50498.1 hypothetical protein THAOC_30508 [Thalassiosira oceanica]
MRREGYQGASDCEGVSPAPMEACNKIKDRSSLTCDVPHLLWVNGYQFLRHVELLVSNSLSTESIQLDYE